MTHPFRFTATLLLAAITAACDSPTAERPEPEPPRIAVGATLEGRVQPGTSNEYVLDVPQGEFRITLRASSGNAADSLVAELIAEAGNAVGGVISMGTDTALAMQASGWLTADAATRWRIRIRGYNPDDGGPYTVRLFPRSAAPEALPANIVVGQTVEGEALDVSGDVDEFVVEGNAGDEWIVFAQSFLDPDHRLEVQLIHRVSGEAVSPLWLFDRAGTLEQLSGGRMKLTRPGPYVLRVSGRSWSFHDEVRGGYRLRIATVNRAPESGTAMLTLGDVASETIGSVGDVDEFTFAGTAGQEMNLLVQLQQGMSAGLSVEILHGGSVVQKLDPAVPAASLDEVGTGRFALPATGTYTVVVSGKPFGLPDESTGSYRFELYPVDRRPEAPGTIALDGPTLSGRVDRPGDVDEFPLAGTEGQLMVIHVAGGAPQGNVLLAEVVDAAERVVSSQIMTGPTTNYGYRVRLPATATYTLRITAAVSNKNATGTYTVGAYTVDPAPEHVGATLSPGQTITGERIDRPGDLDVFTFSGTPGSIVSVFLGIPEGVGSVAASVRPLNMPSPLFFTYGGSMTLDGWSTGRITLEDTPYEVVVDPQIMGNDPSKGTTYALRIFPIDVRPEGRAATYVLGDTVKGEPLYPSGDIDEYTFEIAATTTVEIYWQSVLADPGISVWGMLYREGTEDPLWSNAGLPVRQLTLQPGTYRLRALNPFMNAPTTSGWVPRLNYRFAFIPQ